MNIFGTDSSTNLEYSKPCNRRFTARHFSGTRVASEVRLIVLHDEESSSALGAATWFANPKSEGSAHLTVDEKECYRTLSDTFVPWAAMGANRCGFHIEQAGFAKWSAAIWRKHFRTLKRAACKTAWACKRFEIPARFLTADKLRWNSVGDYIGPKGITTHKEITKAFGGTHTDPGLFWPRRLFMRYVRQFLAAGEAT